MMKYAINPKKKQIKAFLQGTEYDALHYISQELHQTGFACVKVSKYKMAHEYSGTVTLRDGDEWNEEVGKALAKKKCLDNYNRALMKRLDAFVNDFTSIAKRMQPDCQCKNCECE